MASRHFTIAALVAVAVLVGGKAQAHAKLVDSNPTERAIVTAAPQIVLHFNEKLQPRFSGFGLSAGGTAVPIKVGVSRDRLTLVGTPVRALSAGAYEVRWWAVAADAHRMEGSFNFTVR